MNDRFSPPERRVAATLLVVSALGIGWHIFEDLRPPPPPVRILRGAFGADSTDIFDLNVPREGIVYSSGKGEPDGPIDIRTADEGELTLLPGIGPVLAGRIVAWRKDRVGPWRVDDLLEVSGIGPARLARLRPLVTTRPEGPSGTGPESPDRPESGGEWR